MFSLAVRSLDGTSRQIDVAPDTTLADIQALLETQLPAFREIRLVELQVVTMQSPAKALSELERLAPKLLSHVVMLLPEEEKRKEGSEAWQGMLAATQALGEMQEFPPDVSQRLWQLLGRNDVLGMYECGGGDIVESLAATFGHKCGDPIPHSAALVSWLKHRNLGKRNLAAVAGAEIAMRIGDAMPSCMREALMRWAFQEVNKDDDLLACACRLLGLLGNSECTRLLQDVIDRTWSSKNKVAAADALALIGSRSSHKSACAAVAASQEPEHENASGPKGDQVCVDGDTSAGAGQGNDVETDPQLDAVFCESEQEVPLQHQKDLQEIMLRSKADCVSSVVPLEHDSSIVAPDDRLVLLCFNHRPKELFEALLASPLAARVMAAGGEPHPEWAGGKLVLAEGVTEATVSEAREAWHVAVHAANECELVATLRSIFRRERVRVKAPDGRKLAPQGTSFFQLCDSSVAGGAQSSDGPGLASDWADMIVTRRTFIHVPSDVADLSRASASAPAEL